MGKYKKEIKLFLLLTCLNLALIFALIKQVSGDFKMKKINQSNSTLITLPAPKNDSDVSLEKTLFKRRSVRNFKNEPLTLSEVSQLLFSAQGITHPSGFRTAPSAGALYPLEVYLVAGKVSGLEPGVYKYLPENHKLSKVVSGDLRESLCQGALGQIPVKMAPAVLVFSAVLERTTSRYGERGLRYVFMEAGHAGQNVALQAVALNLGTVMIGAFYDEKVKNILKMPAEEVALYIIPVGKF